MPTIFPFLEGDIREGPDTASGPDQRIASHEGTEITKRNKLNYFTDFVIMFFISSSFFSSVTFVLYVADCRF